MTDLQLAEYSVVAIVAAIAVYALAFVAYAVEISQAAALRSDRKLAQKEQVAYDADERSVSRAESSLKAAILLATLGTVLLLLGVTLRGIATARVPWANMYEFSMTGAGVVIAIFLLLSLKLRELRSLGLFVLTPVIFLMLIAQTQWYVPAEGLVPSLQNSHWLTIHVIVAILAISLFSIAAVISLLQLVQHARQERELAGRAAKYPKLAAFIDPIMQRVPSAQVLERLAFQLNAVGFVFWSFTLIFGAIWAHKAWGRYWGWDPKEVWTFVIWIIYAAYLHARFTKGFRGKRAAYFALAGMAAIIINYTVVNTVINGLHSYSGM